jgi:hypothetical protein
MSLNQEFRHTISSSFTHLSAAEFKPIALAIWYEVYTPNLDGLQPDELRKAGYLVDRLMRFNCVSDDRKLELMKLVQDVKHNLHLSNEMPTVLSSVNVEPLARTWYLREDISHVIQPLLEYQTRHYTHH